jgi:hypothetical protein
MKTDAPSSTHATLLSLDGLHSMQCHAAERHSSDALPEAICAWSGILRSLLPHMLGTATTTSRSWRGCGCGCNRGLEDEIETIQNRAEMLPMALWVAPVPRVPQADDAVFALFPYVLVYTKIGVDEEEDDRHPQCRFPPSLRLSPSESRRIGAGAAYNLGLAYHTQALQEPTGARVAGLRTALRAYKAARDMLLSVDSACGEAPFSHEKQQPLAVAPSQSPSWQRRLQLLEDDRLLLLAIANNEGKIREVMHERDGVVESLQRLRRGLEGSGSPAGICAHFTITDALYGDPRVVRCMHSAAA